MADRPLTFKQQKFIAAYIGEANGNATEAARMAGYKQPKMAGNRALTNDDIASRVAAEVAKYTGTAEEVLNELRDVGFADWRDLIEVLRFDKQGRPVKVKMDLTNKVRALELLGKYHQVFVEKQQIDINVRDHRVSLPQSTITEMFQPSETNDDEPKELHA